MTPATVPSGTARSLRSEGSIGLKGALRIEGARESNAQPSDRSSSGAAEQGVLIRTSRLLTAAQMALGSRISLQIGGLRGRVPL